MGCQYRLHLSMPFLHVPFQLLMAFCYRDCYLIYYHLLLQLAIFSYQLPLFSYKLGLPVVLVDVVLVNYQSVPYFFFSLIITTFIVIITKLPLLQISASLLMPICVTSKTTTATMVIKMAAIIVIIICQLHSITSATTITTIFVSLITSFMLARCLVSTIDQSVHLAPSYQVNRMQLFIRNFY